jgi:hypothetical protein
VGGLPGSAGASDGIGSRARFNSPWGVFLDPAGNLFVADTSNHTIRLGQPVPTIQIVLVGSETVLSWPLFASNYVVETSTLLPPNATWLQVAGSPTVLAGNFVLTNTPAVSQAFFRLRRP